MIIDKNSLLMNSQKVKKTVAPAKAGVQNCLIQLDSRFVGNDENGIKTTFYESITFEWIQYIKQGIVRQGIIAQNFESVLGRFQRGFEGFSG